MAQEIGGVHPTTLSYHWRRLGLAKLQKGPAPGTANEEALKELYESVYGKTL